MAIIIKHGPVLIKDIKIPYPMNGDLILPDWCTGLTGTHPGIWISDDGSATYQQKLELSMELIDLEIESTQ